MVNYVLEVIKAFISSRQNDEMIYDVQRWLVEDEKFFKKDAVLREIYTKQEGAENISEEEIRNSFNNVWNNIERKKYISTIFLKSIQVAAVIALFFITTFSAYRIGLKQQEEIMISESHTEIGQISHIKLPDGTIVVANSGTTLLYPNKYISKKREVILLGEASFNVFKDPKHPFVVRAGDLYIKALGTEFTVNAYENDGTSRITLTEGSIEVGLTDMNNLQSNQNLWKAILEPGECLTYDKSSGRSQVKKVNIEDVSLWQSGNLIFKEDTLDEVFKVLNRKFGLVINYDMTRLGTDKYTFYFTNDMTIEQILDIIKEVVGNIKYSISEKSVNIKIL